MPEHSPQIKRALISVTDKTGVAAFARTLHEEFGVEIVSTGGTAAVLEGEGIPVRAIDDLTGFPEMMNGRVKTLHPRVHGGLLAKRDVAEHLEQANQHGIGLIDMVVVNLYAFEATVAKPGVSYEEAIENIDIGGPSMLRSAAKNHAAVTVIIRPEEYDAILGEMREQGGSTTLKTRKRLALEVFEATSAYDNAIYTWLHERLKGEGVVATSTHDGTPASPFMRDKRLFLSKLHDLRYGENPHQKAALYTVQGGSRSDSLCNALQIQGKELSYNNYLDLDAAWTAVREFDEPTTVIVKHLTPCGIASNADIVAAYNHAFACDPVSAFGGVMAFNCSVSAAVIEAIYANGQFIEALIAPKYDSDALDLLTEKPNVRVLATGDIGALGGAFDYRSIDGGMLCMESDQVAEDETSFVVASDRTPSDHEYQMLLFAWKACKSVKSNAIVVAKDGTTVGIGAGQPNRVNSAELAVRQAGDKARGAVAASDAFMPFADSLEVLAQAGVTAVIQPGGSVRDDEVLQTANKAGMAVVFTGVRHFRH